MPLIKATFEQPYKIQKRPLIAKLIGQLIQPGAEMHQWLTKNGYIVL